MMMGRVTLILDTSAVTVVLAITIMFSTTLFSVLLVCLVKVYSVKQTIIFKVSNSPHLEYPVYRFTFVGKTCV